MVLIFVSTYTMLNGKCALQKSGYIGGCVVYVLMLANCCKFNYH